MTIKSSFRFDRINKLDRDFSHLQIFSLVCPPPPPEIPRDIAVTPSILRPVQRLQVSWIRSISPWLLIHHLRNEKKTTGSSHFSQRLLGQLVNYSLVPNNNPRSLCERQFGQGSFLTFSSKIPLQCSFVGVVFSLHISCWWEFFHYLASFVACEKRPVPPFRTFQFLAARRNVFFFFFVTCYLFSVIRKQ